MKLWPLITKRRMRIEIAQAQGRGNLNEDDKQLANGVIKRRAREPYEFSELATFNSERYRGIVHTPEYAALMAAEQERFNERQREEAKRKAAQTRGRGA